MFFPLNGNQVTCYLSNSKAKKNLILPEHQNVSCLLLLLLMLELLGSWGTKHFHWLTHFFQQIHTGHRYRPGMIGSVRDTNTPAQISLCLKWLTIYWEKNQIAHGLLQLLSNHLYCSNLLWYLAHSPGIVSTFSKYQYSWGSKSCTLDCINQVRSFRLTDFSYINVTGGHGGGKLLKMIKKCN